MYFIVLLKEQFESNNILKHFPPVYVLLVNALTHHLLGKHNFVLLLIHKYELGEHLMIRIIHKINSSFFK